MMRDTIRKTVLPSGLTVLTESVPERRTVSVGVWLRSGARDEPGERLGISHFIEHMVFKGTERRDARAIAQSLESLGGHLDAFTGREQVCYYARALSDHLDDVVDVLADIVCRSRLDASEVEREKSVVREEILAYEDNPEEKVNDVLADLVWGGHDLGRPILGTAETVDALDAGMLHDYFGRRYRADHLVLAAAGALEHDRVLELVARHMQPPGAPSLPLSEAPPGFRPTVQHVVRDLQQLYLSLGARGVSDRHSDRETLLVLTTLLGGGMSSRLFQSVREQAGLAYSIYSVHDFYRDAGMLSIQMGVSPDRGREALALTRQELVQLIEHGPSVAEVAAAQAQFRGSMLMEQESVSARMVYLAHEEIYLREITPPEVYLERILAVTRDQVHEAARRYLAPERFTLAALGPRRGEPLGEADWPVAAADPEPATLQADVTPGP
ncbi:MAG TPA: pitrilysin family protein [Candidatus Limnocylindria bacterium]|nr:pitrilysin family protein [Candidatus Limnocylindria bacterium]